MASTATYIDVVLPLALPRLYTYAVPFDQVDAVKVGMRVLVQFGKQKFYAAIVHNIHHNKTIGVEPKLIDSIIDDYPTVSAEHLKVWEWMSTYYMCTMGEVMAAALPVALRLSSETVVHLHPEFEGETTHLKNDEYLIAEALSIQKKLEIRDIQKILSKKNVIPIIKALQDYGIALVAEEVKEKYKAKIESFVTLAPFYQDKKNLQLLFTELERAPKQLNTLLLYLRLAPKYNSIRKSIINKESGDSGPLVNKLIQKEILVESKQEVSRIKSWDDDQLIQFTLSEAQQEAYQKLKEFHAASKPVLLHGITGSGKTHLYLKLMEEQLAENKQVLFLLPEISLTVHLIQRLQRVFGKAVGIYHSRYGTMQRVELWQKVAKGEIKIIVGARSALFLPYQNLGLIIVDEEHDASYKQGDPNPKYHARDTAIMMGHLFKAHIILGSATPSLESNRNAELGKYGKVILDQRFGDASLPHVHLVDMKQAEESRQVHSHFSFEMVNAIKHSVALKEQVILLQNRRGYSSFITCQTCGWIPTCHQCDISLTYYKYRDELHCHYCGFKTKTKTKCMACGSNTMVIKGFGTEKIEDDLHNLLPDLRIDRLDWDAVKTKNAYEEILERVERRETDVLVGTQMVAKGLDFANVTLVGVINADQLLYFPDFRAMERAFQLLVQVSGRAGRKDKKGLVIIQTKNPNHPVLGMISKHDYHAFYAHEIYQRKQFYYPPYCRLIEISLEHKAVEEIDKQSGLFAQRLRKELGTMVLGPTMPPVTRIKGWYIRNILIKMDREKADISGIKNFIRDMVDEALQKEDFKGMRFSIDVDP